LLAAVLALVLALAAFAGAEASGYPKELDAAAIILAAVGVVILIARLLRRG